MSQWPMVKLGDVCERKIPKWDRNGKKKYIDISTVSPETKTVESPQDVLGEDAPSRAQQIIQTDDVLVSTVRPNLNTVAKIPSTFNGHIASTGFCVLRATEKIDPGFLFHFVQTQAFIQQCINKSTGISYPSTTANKIREIQIPLPPLEEQRRIAQILKLVDFQKHTVRHVLSVTFKSLRTSIFHRVSSGPEVEERRLSEICDLYGGASLPKGIPFDNTKDGLLLMKVSDMNEKGNERHIHSTAVHVPSIPENLPNSIAPAHTVVLPKRGAAIATNKKRLTTRYTMLDPNLIGVRCKTPAVNSTYLYEWFENFDLTTITSGSSIPQLNKKDLNPLLIPIPSTTALQGFTGASSKIDEIEQHVRDKLALLEELHQSLATRAFAGQL